jgi:hypothetical protein
MPRQGLLLLLVCNSSSMVQSARQAGSDLLR